MNTSLIILIAVAVVCWLIYRLFYSNKGDEYNRDSRSYDKQINHYDKGTQTSSAGKRGFFSRLFAKRLPSDQESIAWCADFLEISEDKLVHILSKKSRYYKQFMLKKRSGGYRMISAPNPLLLSIQKKIYQKILFSQAVHPAATGFRPQMSIKDNALPHLGQKEVLKVDIADFFGSIRKPKVVVAFKKMGYSAPVAKILAELCTLKGKLPQGAATSPALSNIMMYDTDVEISRFTKRRKLQYTRYADDITFSGEKVPYGESLSAITIALLDLKLEIQMKKIRRLTEKKRKIITGISVSSGEKLAIPKKKKREIRKNVYFILTKGLKEHQKFIGSKDPAYLKRIIGQLNFWLMVEPENEYVKKSIEALKKL